MATKQQQDERLAVAVNDIATMKDDIKEIKEILKAQDARFARFEAHSDKRFITRMEGKVAMAIFSIVVVLVNLFFSLKDSWK